MEPSSKQHAVNIKKIRKENHTSPQQLRKPIADGADMKPINSFLVPPNSTQTVAYDSFGDPTLFPEKIQLYASKSSKQRKRDQNDGKGKDRVSNEPKDRVSNETKDNNHELEKSNKKRGKNKDNTPNDAGIENNQKDDNPKDNRYIENIGQESGEDGKIEKTAKRQGRNKDQSPNDDKIDNNQRNGRNKDNTPNNNVVRSTQEGGRKRDNTLTDSVGRGNQEGGRNKDNNPNNNVGRGTQEGGRNKDNILSDNVEKSNQEGGGSRKRDNTLNNNVGRGNQEGGRNKNNTPNNNTGKGNQADSRNRDNTPSDNVGRGNQEGGRNKNNTLNDSVGKGNQEGGESKDNLDKLESKKRRGKNKDKTQSDSDNENNKKEGSSKDNVPNTDDLEKNNQKKTEQVPRKKKKDPLVNLQNGDNNASATSVLLLESHFQNALTVKFPHKVSTEAFQEWKTGNIPYWPSPMGALNNSNVLVVWDMENVRWLPEIKTAPDQSLMPLGCIQLMRRVLTEDCGAKDAQFYVSISKSSMPALPEVVRRNIYELNNKPYVTLMTPEGKSSKYKNQEADDALMSKCEYWIENHSKPNDAILFLTGDGDFNIYAEKARFKYKLLVFVISNQKTEGNRVKNTHTSMMSQDVVHWHQDWYHFLWYQSIGRLLSASN